MRAAEAGIPVIAIDGPGGAGKGTIAQAVARHLGWRLLDSGALYRLVGLAAAEAGLAGDDEPGLGRLAAGLDVAFEPAGTSGLRVLLGGRDVSDLIRSEAVGKAASRAAVLPAVRSALLGRQRRFRQAPGLVADGRDMGTVVFPDATLKIFLTAEVGERARRRHKQLKEKGIDVSLPALLKDMTERDRRDAERAVAPLQASPDARVLDSTDMSIDEVVATVLEWTAAVLPGKVSGPGSAVP